MQKETIQRFKEFSFILCFLLLVVSFSGRSFGFKVDKNKAPVKVELISKTISVSYPTSISLEKMQVSVILLTERFVSYDLKEYLETRNVSLLLSLLQKKFLYTKTQIFSVFYYNLFSSRGETPA